MNQPLAQPSATVSVAELIETTVTDVVQGFLLLPYGLLRLHTAGIKADREDLEDAVVAMTNRDGLLAGVLDAHELLEQAPSVHVRNFHDYAVAQFDEDLKVACLSLARVTGDTGSATTAALAIACFWALVVLLAVAVVTVAS